MFSWMQCQSNLRFREDEFSWQGSTLLDYRFFLRRRKEDPRVFSDVLLGRLTNVELCPIIKEFILRSGGIRSSQLAFSCIAPKSDAQSSAKATADRIHQIFTLTGENMNFSTSDYELMETDGSYTMILKLSHCGGS